MSVTVTGFANTRTLAALAGFIMDWQEIWRGTVAGGREVVVHEEDEGDIRVSATTKEGDGRISAGGRGEP